VAFDGPGPTIPPDGTPPPVVATGGLVAAVHAHAQQHGGRVAVRAHDGTLTYAALLDQAGCFAAGLADAGVRAGELVLLLSDRSTRTVAGLLGTLMHGAAYTIVDELPAQGLAGLGALQPDFVVADAAQAGTLRRLGLRAAAWPALLQRGAACSGIAPAQQPVPDDPAYVLFTSGTTGQPKGVLVSHANVDHYVQAIARVTAVPPGLHYAHVSTLSADLGNTSLFLALHTGGCLHLVDDATRRDPMRLAAYFMRHEVQFLKITPSHWNALRSGSAEARGWVPRLSHLVFGGEPLQKDTVRRAWSDGAARDIFNHYGPTETTVGVTAWPVTGPEALDAVPGRTVPIGRPLGRTQLLVSSGDGGMHTRGATGELLVAGPGVALGYRHQAEATRERFVTLDTPHGRLRCYRTGDRVQLLDDGTALFLGRVDRQVKIRGRRVELEAVEDALRSLAGVQDAHAAAIDSAGRPRLLAAVQARGLAPEALRQALRSTLPAHMVPQRIACLAAFPRNGNGKTDAKALVRWLAQQLPGDGPGTSLRRAADRSAESRAVRDTVAPVYARFVDPGAGPEVPFHEAGADSLDTVQLLAELQFRGFDISAHDFAQAPTLDGLVDSILRNRHRAAPPPGAAEADGGRRSRLAPAQQQFFAAAPDEPDRCNQAVLLRIDGTLQESLLQAVLHELQAEHELLRTAFARQPDGLWCAETVAAGGRPLLTTSTVDPDREAEVVHATADALHGALRLADGDVFRAHLFRLQPAGALLLLVAHHLCVDVLSWRLITAALFRRYADRRDGRPPAPAGRPAGFWHWVDHLPRQPAAPPAGAPATPVAAHVLLQPHPHRESDCETTWLAWSRAQTLALDRAAARHGVAPHVLFLGAFVQAFAAVSGLAEQRVDVESHGRVGLDARVDPSRTVGWHTVVMPLALHAHAGDCGATFAATAAAMAGARRQEAAGQWHRPAATDRAAAPACYNFIGDVDFALDDRVQARPAPHRVGRTRGGANLRSHLVKLTVRRFEGQYLADASYPGVAQGALQCAMREVMHRLHALLNPLLPDHTPFAVPWVEPGHRTGALHSVPAVLLEAPPPPAAAAAAVHAPACSHRAYGHAVLTGATGFMGVHLLRELLQRSTTRITCLVRGASDDEARARVQDHWRHHFPDLPWTPAVAGVQVVAADIARPRLGLPPERYRQLAATTEAVYHFAADTRLAAPQAALAAINVGAAGHLARFARDGRAKDLHWMSTLAVCGVHPGPAAQVFDEDSLDIGQRFQNSYEATKYRAELLLRRQAMEGLRVFVYRSGNVSADSRSGRFQRDARSNRLVQLVDACVSLGELPRDLGEPVSASPVDVVCAGIAALSLDAAQAPGVYHVETPHVFPLAALFEALRAEGFAFRTVDAADLRALFDRRHVDGDAAWSIGRYWSGRQPRNVRWDSTRTLRALERHGIRFDPPDPRWIAAFVKQLVATGAIRRPATGPHPAPSPQEDTQHA
jgi:amino acid adenylation domain-containing protein/thioester reductase-like protein